MLGLNRINSTKLIFVVFIIAYFFVIYLAIINRVVLPIGFDIFGFKIHYYSIILLIAAILPASIINKFISNYPELRKIDITDLLLYVSIFGILGSRIFFVLINFEEYRTDFTEILNLRDGGLNIFGGLLFGLVSIFVYAKKNKINFIELINLVSIFVPLGQFIGRIGNFLNQELYGPVTSLPWAWYVKSTNQLHHPSFLYEQILNLILFLFLFSRFKRIGLDYKYFPLYLVGYSVIRFIVEYFRIENKYMLDVTAGQMMSIITFFVGIILFFSMKNRKTNLEIL